MAQPPATLPPLATELKDRILDFCDWPTLVNMLRVSKHWHWLAYPRVANNPDARRRFLYTYERSVENVCWEDLPGIDVATVVAMPPEKQFLFGKRLYVCCVCEKLKRPRAFARGQLDGGMGTKRFCLECGAGGASPRYRPGSTVTVFSVGLGWRDATLCKQCRAWCHGEYCMKEKLCARCVEQRSGVGNFELELDRPETTVRLAVPDRCVSCGGKWFFSRPAYYRKLREIRAKHPPIRRLSRPPTTVIMQLLVSRS